MSVADARWAIEKAKETLATLEMDEKYLADQVMLVAARYLYFAQNGEDRPGAADRDTADPDTESES